MSCKNSSSTADPEFVLDLTEVTLVDADVVRFLGAVKSTE